MYFPAFHETNIACGKCDKEKCDCRGKFQRNRRDFEVTSGRCPKVPDRRGFVAPEERANQRDAYSFAYIEISDESVYLHINIPGDKKQKRLYRTKSGYWYYRTKDEDGNKIRRAVFFGANDTIESFRQFGERLGTDYYLFPCDISDSTV